jgi:hypothetical protein
MEVRPLPPPQAKQPDEPPAVNTKNIPPIPTNPALWVIPRRAFGDATFLRSSVGNDSSLNTAFNFRSAREWMIASIAINPNTQEFTAANPYLTEAQKRTFLKNLFPDSIFFNDNLQIIYQEIILNTSLVTTVANTTSPEWRSVMNFWAYPNGEFSPVTAVTNLGNFVNYWPFPPQNGNPQNPQNFAINSRYTFIKNEGQSFEITTVPTIIAFGSFTNGMNNFISKTFTEPGWYYCNVQEFGNPLPDPLPVGVST